MGESPVLAVSLGACSMLAVSALFAASVLLPLSLLLFSLLPLCCAALSEVPAGCRDRDGAGRCGCFPGNLGLPLILPL